MTFIREKPSNGNYNLTKYDLNIVGRLSYDQRRPSTVMLRKPQNIKMQMPFRPTNMKYKKL